MKNNKTVIIAFGHEAQHGKDTAAQHIQSIYDCPPDFRVLRYAFADELKREVNEMMLAKREQLSMCSTETAWRELCREWNVAYDEKPIMTDPLCPYGKQRPMLQFWGEYMRREDPFHWVGKVETRIDRDQPEFALITDMRYWNCACWVKARNGYTVRCRRIGYSNPNINSQHISERDLDRWNFDYYITTPKDDLKMNYTLAEAIFRDIQYKPFKSSR